MKPSYRALHINYLRGHYGKAAERWQGITTDDRLVYCNVYRLMIEALESLPENPNNYVCVAMNQKMNSDCAMLDRILGVFADR